ncbi:MAG: tyrosine--tRNA ligase [bacterium]|nr:tyrosine--tRNA ligase [bacterium]
MKTVTIEEVLTRKVEEVLPGKAGLKRLMKGRKIRLYLGVDPTGRKLHLGHTIPLRKLQEFASLGNEAILVVGTGTVLTGDPSQREKNRSMISKKEIEKNIKGWKGQVGRILDFSKVKIRYNGEWLLKMKLEEIVNVASRISAIKLFQRDMFQRRLKRGDTVWTHETLYPLLQGYDSVFLDVDLEIGGSDQVFNMLIGRELLRKMKKKEKFVMTLPMVLGTDGEPMSKTSGNCIWLDDSPEQMFGKVMSVPDSLIVSYYELLTDISSKQVQGVKKSLLQKKVNPKELKKKLAFEIVEIYHSSREAEKAKREFEKVFEKKELPSAIPSLRIGVKNINILDLLVRAKLASSKSEAKRLILQGGVKIGGSIQKDWGKTVEIKKTLVLQVGPRKFARIY